MIKDSYRAKGTPAAVGALCAALLRRPIFSVCRWPNSHKFCPMAAVVRTLRVVVSGSVSCAIVALPVLLLRRFVMIVVSMVVLSGVLFVGVMVGLVVLILLPVWMVVLLLFSLVNARAVLWFCFRGFFARPLFVGVVVSDESIFENFFK